MENSQHTSIKQSYSYFNPTYISSSEIIPTNGQWKYWGIDNLLPNEYIDMINWSPIHSVAINMVIRSIKGNSLIVNNEVDLNYFNQTNPFLLEEIWESIVYDWVVLGQTSAKYNLTMDKSKWLIYPISASEIRVDNSFDYKTNKSDGYWFSYNWAQHGMPDFIPCWIKSYDKKNRHKIEPDNWVEFIYRNVNNTKTNRIYGTPYYESARLAIEMQLKINKFNLNNIETDFSPKLLISMPGITDQVQQKTIVESTESTYKGENKRTSCIYMFPSSPEFKPDVTILNTSIEDGHFDQLQKSIEQQILSAHQIISGEIIGIPTGGQSLGGDANKIKVAYEMFDKQVIEQQRIKLLKQLNTILEIGNWNLRVTDIVKNDFELTNNN